MMASRAPLVQRVTLAIQVVLLEPLVPRVPLVLPAVRAAPRERRVRLESPEPLAHKELPASKASSAPAVSRGRLVPRA